MASKGELKGSLKRSERASRISDERFPSNPSSRHQGKVKERSRDTGNEIRIRSNALEHSHSRPERVTESFKPDDELVRYMSKLPTYLQRKERGESFQGKVLNVGVLDWGRLEKWKHGREGARATNGNNASSRSINVSENVERKVSHRYKIDEQFPTLSNLDSSSKDDTSRDLQHSVQRVRCSREPEPVSRDSLNMQKNEGCSHKSTGRDRAGVDPGKSRRTRSSKKFTSGLFSDMGSLGVSLGVKESTVACDGDTENRGEGIHDAEANQRAQEPLIDSDIAASSVRSRKCSISLGLVEKQIVKNDGSRKMVEESQDSEADLDSREQGKEYSNIVLLRPKKHTWSAVPGQPQMSLDDNLGEAKQDNFSTNFAKGNGLRSQIPRSFPLSLDFEKESGSSILPLGVDPPSDACKNKPFRGKHLEDGCTSDVETTGMLDQEKSEDESRKSRPPSPGRRFSFSFSRLGRSFSFKEGSAAQPSSSDDSIKSGPVRFENGSACPDGSINPEKPSIIHNRARASPLRRLLDPLLKPRSTKYVPSSKARSTSSNLKPVNGAEPLQEGKKQDISTTRALVQLTITNSLPLFRFVVDDNSSNILVATVKNSASSAKDNSVQYCTFYSVNEAKKKKRGSWLIHGNKEKQCGFIYDIVGQMRLSNPLSSDIAGQSFGNHCPVRESVLFEFELKHSDQATEKIKASRELAAVVINKPGQNPSSKSPKNNVSMTENGLEEDGDVFGAATIILPGGVHSFPNKGAPSPLIDRWRSGGLCDCGGWDLGCKLRVLIASKVRSPCESFQLFDQEGAQQNNPAFTMKQLKTGIHTVEFSSSISLLQAFFICVTVITCDCGQRSDDPKFSTRSEPRAPEDTASKPDDQTKNSQMPVRYSPFNPPLSPVGRV